MPTTTTTRMKIVFTLRQNLHVAKSNRIPFEQNNLWNFYTLSSLGFTRSAIYQNIMVGTTFNTQTQRQNTRRAMTNWRPHLLLLASKKLSDCGRWMSPEKPFTHQLTEIQELWMPQLAIEHQPIRGNKRQKNQNKCNHREADSCP